MAQELIIMTPKELSRYGVIERLLNEEIDGTEAAKQLALSVRQVKRIKVKVKRFGAKGIIHDSRDKPSNRKLSDKQVEEIEKIVKADYPDFGPTFAAEKLGENHDIQIGKEKLRQLMINWDCWKPKPRKENKEYRAWRQRKEQYGEMEQFDGSYHDWFEGRAEPCCLLGSIDDATSQITKLEFCYWEGVQEAYSFWKDYVETRGKPLIIYLDRHSTYKQNQKSVFDDPECLTQFQRAMERDLGVKLIHAYSSQAKGRAERMFNTLQDRLIKELRLAGISDRKEANKFAKEVFIPKHNAKFAVLPQKKGDLHRPLTEFEKNNLDKFFSIQHTRVVNNDFTIRYKGKWYQLSARQPTLVLRKDKVLIEERMDDSLFISLRDKYLNYTVLPARPKKVEMKVIALTRTKSTWKPSANHPWRRPFILNPEKKYRAGSLAKSGS